MVIRMNLNRPMKSFWKTKIRQPSRKSSCQLEQRHVFRLLSQRAFNCKSRSAFQARNANFKGPEKPIESERLLYQGLEISESKQFALGSSLATRLSTDRTLQCTEFDDKGNIVARNVEIKKSDLVNKFGILSRDLRKIDDEHDFPAILVRESTILVNFLQHRALITYKRVLVVHLGTPNTGINYDSSFMYGLQGKLNFGISQHSNLPYEFRALETVLVMVISELDVEYQKIKTPVNKLLDELQHDVSLEKLKQLLDVSKQASAFRQNVQRVRTALHTVLEADDDMAAMYLSGKAAGTPRQEADHTEIELLIENYYDASGEIVDKADKLLSDVEYTYDSVRSILDSHRNSIMMLDVQFSIAAVGLGMATYVVGLYGMNLINGLEENIHGFSFITGGSVIGILGVGIFGLYKLRRVRKIYSMHGMHYDRRHRTKN
ncbi:hypothetical protein BJ878DRAFT_505778 [Calycina marina]|uniref:Magnesium transporter n=1 Tax=Calycina marina TaxID=1763456 RepID=A0A9P8CEV9_9HELO|nr:hypothetical protein BJ878DRAFT_505778 [Calycina marina]